MQNAKLTEAKTDGRLLYREAEKIELRLIKGGKSSTKPKRVFAPRPWLVSLTVAGLMLLGLSSWISLWHARSDSLFPIRTGVKQESKIKRLERDYLREPLTAGLIKSMVFEVNR